MTSTPGLSGWSREGEDDDVGPTGANAPAKSGWTASLEGDDENGPSAPDSLSGREVDPFQVENWPAPLSDVALSGLTGDFVRAIAPHTEADPAALALQFLAAFGNVIGRSAHFAVEATIHFLNLFVALVGPTAKARKGTALDHVYARFLAADPQWATESRASGLSSGEGLIWRIRDTTYDADGDVEDQGVDDKRLNVVETEFASVLRVLGRENSILSAILRQAWDGNSALQTMSKVKPARATDPHISVIAHVSQLEAQRYLDRTEVGNGFGNRFLWGCTKRSQCLPEGAQPDPTEMGRIEDRLARAVDFARKGGLMKRDADARELWFEVYPELSEGRPGMFGAMTARAEAQVMRMSCLYALLEMSYVVRRPHLEAALEMWRYCRDSVLYVFGDSIGDPVADEILRELRSRPGGMTRTEIRDLFGRNKKSKEISKALGLLIQYGLAVMTPEGDTGGRPVERWSAVVLGGK